MIYWQIENPIFALALLANISLLVIVVNYAQKNISRYLFSFFVLAQIFWISFNYAAFKIPTLSFLTMARLTMFFATFHVYFFFAFIQTFLSPPNINHKKTLVPFTVLLVAVATLTLTSLVFDKIEINSLNQAAPHSGPGMPFFGAFVGLCILGSILSTYKKFKASAGIQKLQWKYLSLGLFLTFLLVLTFSFINFAVFNNLNSVKFGHLYTLPFIAFTAYAMVKHRLLNIKTIIAELASILLNFILIIQIINSDTAGQKLTGVIVLFGTLLVSVLLVKGVRKEVEQREQLEVLTGQLGEANEKLKALDKARSEFITIASHQLRTPPATIKWYLSAVLAGDFGKLTDEQKNVIDKANRTNSSQISLIDDMLNVSRIERGKMEFLFEETDLAPLAQITYEQLIPQSADKGIKLEYIAPKKALPKIMADKEKIRQVMNNLIDNALKYTKEGSVTIKLFQEGEDIKFVVTDTGKGISPEEANSIFEKFSRGKESVKQSAGLGLGLYVAKIVIQQHKGKIWAESPGTGKGSSFIFSLPIHTGLKETTLLDLTKKQ